MNRTRALKIASATLSFVFAAGLGLLESTSCTVGTVPTIDCATTTVQTYATLKGSVMAYCTDCHGANRADRGLRYDTYAAATAAAAIGAETIADGSMPEDIDMPDSAAQAFYAWSQCGTPE